MSSPGWKTIPGLEETLAGASLEDLDVALAEVDATGRLFHINPRAERAWGWQTGQQVPPALFEALGTVADGSTQALPPLTDGGALFGVSVPGRGWLLLGYETGAAQAEALSIFKSLIEKVPALVVRLHPDGTVRYAGRAAAAVLGYAPEALVGKPLWLDVVHPEDRWKLTEALRRAAETRRVVGLSVRFLTAQDALRQARFYLIPADDDDAEIEGLIFNVTTEVEAAPGLMQSEALYRTFLEQSPLGILHLDVAGLVTFENHRFRQIVGEAVDDAWIGRRFDEIDGLEPHLPPLVAQMLREGQAIEGTAVAYQRGSKQQHLAVHGSPIRQPGGAIVGAVMMIEDVTETRRREEELRLRKRYEQAEAALRDAVLADLDETIFLHEAAAAFGQTSRADRVHVLIHAGDEGLCVSQAAWVRRQVDEPLALSVRSADYAPLRTAVVQRRLLYLRTDAAAEARALLEQTEAHEVLWVPFFDAGRLGGFVLFERLTPPEETPTWPETEQRLIDHLARLFETLWSWIQVGRRYRLTVATIDDCLFTFRYDAAGHRRYLFITPQVESLTGYPAEAVLTRTETPFRWSDTLIHPDDRDAVQAHDAALRNGRESRITYRIQHQRGTDRWLCEHATPHHDAAGNVTISGILVDVTEQKDAEEILLSARAQVESVSQLRSTFVATMSHELRTPLGAIHGFADLLAQELADYEAQTGTPLPASVREFADAVRDNARRVLQLADDLFAWSNAGQGALRLEREAVPLHALAQRCAARIRETLAEKNLPLTLDLAAEEPVALGDAQRIEQILDNLLSNAAKFTDAGAVTLRTRTTAEHAIIEVEDTGIGIDPAHTERLFTPFMQGDNRLNRRFEGTGLGLALVKRLLDLMDGTIEVTSEKGHGSTFCVRLPRAES